MFTLKFVSRSDQGETATVISCDHYSVWTPESHKDFIEVTLFKDYTSKDGVTYRVGPTKDVAAFDVCFVGNINGKTIDRIAM